MSNEYAVLARLAINDALGISIHSIIFPPGDATKTVQLEDGTHIDARSLEGLIREIGIYLDWKKAQPAVCNQSYSP